MTQTLLVAQCGRDRFIVRCLSQFPLSQPTTSLTVVKLTLDSPFSNRAVTKFDFGPLVVNLDTSSMYFICKILNSMVFGLMTKLLQSVQIF